MSTDAVFEAVFAHAGPWSEEDYLAIPETPARIELASGVLVVNALPDTYHQRLARRFGNLLEQTCPTLDWEVYEGEQFPPGPDRQARRVRGSGHPVLRAHRPPPRESRISRHRPTD